MQGRPGRPPKVGRDGPQARNQGDGRRQLQARARQGTGEQPRGAGGKAAGVAMPVMLAGGTGGHRRHLARLAEHDLGREAGGGGKAAGANQAAEAELQDQRVEDRKDHEEM